MDSLHLGAPKDGWPRATRKNENPKTILERNSCPLSLISKLRLYEMNFIDNRKEIKPLLNLMPTPRDETPFYEQAETHFFSDWLLTYLTGVGVEDLTEYYAGVFPDLSELIDREKTPPSVHAQEIHKLVQTSTLPLAKALRKFVKARIWVDLGCGIPDLSVVPRVVAESCGAKSYIGIDLGLTESFTRRNEFKIQPNFESTFRPGDLRDFLRTKNLDGPCIYYLAGVELRDGLPPSHLEELSGLLSDRCSTEDLVLVGAGCPDLEPSSKHFKLIYKDYYHFLFRKRGKGLFRSLFFKR